MRIGIFLNPYSKDKGGLERYVHETVSSLIESDQKNTYIFYVNNTNYKNLNFKGKNWKAVAHDYSGFSFKFFGVVNENADLYIFFTPIVPIFHGFKKSIVVFFDAAFFYFKGDSLQDRISSLIQYFLQKYGMLRATKVIAISRATKKDATEKLKIPERKIDVIYCGYTNINKSNNYEEVVLPNGRYFLYAGPLKDRKNIHRIVKAFLITNEKLNNQIHLVLAGRISVHGQKKILKLAENTQSLEKIIFPGYVTDHQLAFLYKHAQAFVFPSLLEGFGLPILEAMSFGCPVITSNCSSLPEVAGDAAILVNPYSVEDISDAMISIYNKEVDVDSLIEKGYKRTQQFSWKVSAEKWIELINNIGHE